MSFAPLSVKSLFLPIDLRLAKLPGLEAQCYGESDNSNKRSKKSDVIAYPLGAFALCDGFVFIL